MKVQMQDPCQHKPAHCLADVFLLSLFPPCVCCNNFMQTREGALHSSKGKSSDRLWSRARVLKPHLKNELKVLKIFSDFRRSTKIGPREHSSILKHYILLFGASTLDEAYFGRSKDHRGFSFHRRPHRSYLRSGKWAS